MKTKQELEELRNGVFQLKKKLRMLTDDELAQVIGGVTSASKAMYGCNVTILGVSASGASGELTCLSGQVLSCANDCCKCVQG